MKNRLALVLLVALSTSCMAQGGYIHGNGDPRTLTPTPNCGGSRFYVDDSTGRLYIAAQGSPCAWTDAAPVAAPISGLTAGYVPLAGSATTITGNSHIDDGATTAGQVTVSEALVVGIATAALTPGYIMSSVDDTTGAWFLGADRTCFFYRASGTLSVSSGCGPMTVSNSVTANSFISPTVGRIGTTASIGGGALIAGTCASGTVAVSGAVVGRPVAVSASDGTLPNALATLAASVTATDTVSVQVCAIAAVTPAAKTYNVSVL